jgi:hypothetical protein
LGIVDHPLLLAAAVECRYWQLTTGNYQGGGSTNEFEPTSQKDVTGASASATAAPDAQPTPHQPEAASAESILKPHAACSARVPGGPPGNRGHPAPPAVSFRHLANKKDPFTDPQELRRRVHLIYGWDMPELSALPPTPDPPRKTGGAPRAEKENGNKPGHRSDGNGYPSEFCGPGRHQGGGTAASNAGYTSVICGNRQNLRMKRRPSVGWRASGTERRWKGPPLAYIPVGKEQSSGRRWAASRRATAPLVE